MPGAARQYSSHSTPSPTARPDVASGREAARLGPGRDDQSVEREGVAVGQAHGPARRVEGDGPALDQADPEVGVVAGLPQPDAFVLPGAGEYLLGERRAVVGQLRLAADQGERAGVPGAAQGLRRGHGGRAAADDDDAVHRRRA